MSLERGILLEERYVPENKENSHLQFKQRYLFRRIEIMRLDLHLLQFTPFDQRRDFNNLKAELSLLTILESSSMSTKDNYTS